MVFPVKPSASCSRVLRCHGDARPNPFIQQFGVSLCIVHV